MWLFIKVKQKNDRWTFAAVFCPMQTLVVKKLSLIWCIGDSFPPPQSQILSFCSLYFRWIYSAPNTAIVFPPNIYDDFNPPQMSNLLFLLTSKICVGHFSDANEKNPQQMIFKIKIIGNVFVFVWAFSTANA